MLLKLYIFSKLLSLLKLLFITDKGSFNWVAVTSIVAILTLIWSVVFNTRKYKSDLITKERIQWMTEARPLVAKFISLVPAYVYEYELFAVDNEIDKRDDLAKRMKEIRETYYLLRIYGIADKNTELSKYINLLWGELSYITPYYNYARNHGLIKNVRTPKFHKKVDKYISELVNQASIFAGKYFDDQWNKVKNGK